MKHALLALLAASIAVGAGKPSACTRYPATVYVATGPTYGITGDADPANTLWIDGVFYTRYVDGKGGVQAYVNGGSCAGTFFFTLNGSRKLNLLFQNWQNNGTSGPPSGTPPPETPAWKLFLRGFSFAGGQGAVYTTMLPVDFSAPNKSFAGGGVRYEPLTSDFLTGNPDFPTYPDMNSPCATSAVEMAVISPSETSVSPLPVSCGAYSGSVASLIQEKKGSGPYMVNVGQYGMNFRFRIVVNGFQRY